MKQPHILPQDVTLPNSINSMNFWHTFDSGSKFEILKPNSSWLTFGISKFVSLSISRFLFLFFLKFFCIVLSYTNPLAITSQNHYYFGYYISKALLFWLLHQNLLPFWLLHFKSLSFWLFHLKILISSYCIKLNIDTNHHIGHFSCKSAAIFTLTDCCSVMSTTGPQSKTAFQ